LQSETNESVGTLRRIDAKVDGLRGDMAEVKERLGFLEAGYASLSRRVDRLGGDMDQIKRRLDIVDAPIS
jgi:hypothetical protein